MISIQPRNFPDPYGGLATRTTSRPPRVPRRCVETSLICVVGLRHCPVPYSYIVNLRLLGPALICKVGLRLDVDALRPLQEQVLAALELP